MNPSKFCDFAMEYELTIRGIPYDKTKPWRPQAERELRRRFREEKEDPTKRPQPRLQDLSVECEEIAHYVDQMVQRKETLKDFRDSDLVERLYHQLCFAERRLAYMNIEEVESTSKTANQYHQLLEFLEDFRQENFADRPPHVIFTVTQVSEELGEDESQRASFTAEDERKLSEVRKQMADLMKRKEIATTKNVSYDEDVGDEDEEEEVEYPIQRTIPAKVAPKAQVPENVRTQGEPRMSRSLLNRLAARPTPPPNRSRFEAAIDNLPNLSSTMSSSGHTGQYKGLPVHKWQLKFKGATDGSLVTFLQDVEIRMNAERMSSEMLFQRFSFLLEAEAAEWYKVKGIDCSSLDELLAALRNDFIPIDFDYKTEQEIRSTQQRSDETFQSFWIRMENLFQKLSYTITENEKLEHMKHLMLKKYKSVETARCKTVEKLKEHCRFRDSIDDVSRPNPTVTASSRPLRRVSVVDTSVMEEECAAEDCESLENEITEAEIQAMGQRLQQTSWRSSRPSASASTTPAAAGVKCFNCGITGHAHSQCTKPRTTFCYRCGKKSFYSWNCPDCVNKNTRQNSTPQSSSGNVNRPQT